MAVCPCPASGFGISRRRWWRAVALFVVLPLSVDGGLSQGVGGLLGNTTAVLISNYYPRPSFARARPNRVDASVVKPGAVSVSSVR